MSTKKKAAVFVAAVVLAFYARTVNGQAIDGSGDVTVNSTTS